MLAAAALDTALSPAEVLASFDSADEPVQVLQLCCDLYAGVLADMAEDLRRRQAGRPYLFRTELDPAAALAWVERFRSYETARGESLTAALAGGEAEE